MIVSILGKILKWKNSLNLENRKLFTSLTCCLLLFRVAIFNSLANFYPTIDLE